VETTFATVKTTRRVQARVEAGAGPFAGARGVVCEAYEIHAGQTRVLAPVALRLFTVVARDGAPADALDGVGDTAGVVTGTYLHGFFASGAVRRSLLGWLATRTGRPVHPAWGATRPRSERWDRLADVVAAGVNLEAIGKLVGDPR
jgi:adenosylcobyric acid synthase